jgi:hypothetical protein
MNKKIITEFKPDPRYPKGSFYKYRPVIVYSTHPKYRVGTRFDYGFMHIAIEAGYDVLLLGSSYKPAEDLE